MLYTEDFSMYHYVRFLEIGSHMYFKKLYLYGVLMIISKVIVSINE